MRPIWTVTFWLMPVSKTGPSSSSTAATALPDDDADDADDADDEASPWPCSGPTSASTSAT